MDWMVVHTHTCTATGICSRDMQNLTTGSCVSLTTSNMGRRKGKMLGWKGGISWRKSSREQRPRATERKESEKWQRDNLVYDILVMVYCCFKTQKTSSLRLTFFKVCMCLCICAAACVHTQHECKLLLSALLSHTNAHSFTYTIM